MAVPASATTGWSAIRVAPSRRLPSCSSAASSFTSTEIAISAAPSEDASAAPSPASSRVSSNRVKPSDVYRARSVCVSGSRRSSPAQPASIGTSDRSVESSRLSRASSACAIRPSRAFFAFTCSADASSVSRSPYSPISFAAPFSPMPFTPGMLSEGSPTRARTSSSFDGGTPKRSSTAAASMRRPLPVSSISTPPPTSCIRSLSVETMQTSAPFGAPATSVAITSSASKSSIVSIGTPNASQISATIGICAERSSGCLSRPALYSGNTRLRKLPPRGSEATATWVGRSSRRTFASMVAKP